jgi:lipid A 3-O-deacylase
MIRKTALAAALAFALPALAIDSVSLETGRGDEGTELLRAGAQWNWQKRWFTERSWTLGAYWDVQVGRWTGTTDDLWDFSVTPVFRLERARRANYFPYAEAAIGFHLLSDIRVSPQRRFSTNFQYGDHLGVGVRYGERFRYDLGVRLQHLSNGGLRRPNPGINFWQLRLQYHFR